MRLILFIFFLSGQIYGLECSQFKDDCEYYSCVEAQKHCGKKKYPLGFGRRYCLKFDQRSEDFSEAGQKWLQSTKECLISASLEKDDGLSCKEFKRESVKLHVPCYINSGYCDLPNRDKKLVKKIIYKSLWRPSLVWAGLKVLRGCKKK